MQALQEFEQLPFLLSVYKIYNITLPSIILKAALFQQQQQPPPPPYLS